MFIKDQIFSVNMNKIDKTRSNCEANLFDLQDNTRKIVDKQFFLPDWEIVV